MPRWLCKVCSALYCPDCFIFPFPGLFLHCTVQTEGSMLGLIANRVKQDIDAQPLNPHWASSEWHTWLLELNGGRGIESFAVLTQRAGGAKRHCSPKQEDGEPSNHKDGYISMQRKLDREKDKFTYTRPDRSPSSHLARQAASWVSHGGGDGKTLEAGNDSREAAAPPACIRGGQCLTRADRPRGEGALLMRLHNPSPGPGTFLKGCRCDTVPLRCQPWNL